MIPVRPSLLPLLPLLPLCFSCGPTEVLIGDSPGLSRIVAGIPGVSADLTPDSLPSGDALERPLGEPRDVAALDDGGFWIADRKAQRVGFVEPGGVLSWPIGGGECSGIQGDLNHPREFCLLGPSGLVLEATGSLIIADDRAHRVYRHHPDEDRLEVILGFGGRGESPDGVPAATARTDGPVSVTVGPDGSVYVAELFNSRIVRIDPAGTLRVVAGSGETGDEGDGGPALEARLVAPEGIALVGDTLYIADTGNHRLRRVIRDTIYAYAGIGSAGFAGDGASVSLALFNHPARLRVSGTLLFVSDRDNNRIRVIRLGPDSIETFGGTGSPQLGSDLLEVGRTELDSPNGVGVAGRVVYIADSRHFVIRRVVR